VKASSVVVSAGETAEHARRLEQAIREEKWDELVDDYRDLVAAFRRTTVDLKHPVQGDSRAPQPLREFSAAAVGSFALKPIALTTRPQLAWSCAR